MLIKGANSVKLLGMFVIALLTCKYMSIAAVFIWYIFDECILYHTVHKRGYFVMPQSKVKSYRACWFPAWPMSSCILTDTLHVLRNPCVPKDRVFFAVYIGRSLGITIGHRGNRQLVDYPSSRGAIRTTQIKVQHKNHLNISWHMPQIVSTLL